MLCTARRRSRSRFVLGCSLALGMVLVGAAQDLPGPEPAPSFEPPACSNAAKAPAHSDALERARLEQTEGLRDPRAIPSAEPVENFGVARYRLVEYGSCIGDAGCYWADLDAQFKRAQDILAAELGSPRPSRNGGKLAVIMDIDETALSNWCEMRREDFGYIGPMYSRWEVSLEAATPIPGALRLFRQAKAAGVAVFFITGRPGTPNQSAGSKSGTSNPDETAATARNLEAAGFHGWAGLSLRKGTENGMPTIQYKSLERRRIQTQGYEIVLSVGDQWSDLLGDPQADRSVKLPNPFYFIP